MVSANLETRRRHALHMLSSLRNLLAPDEGSHLLDVTVRLKDGSTSHSHSLILASLSPLLRRCLAESSSEEPSAMLLVPDLSVQDWANLNDALLGKDPPENVERLRETFDLLGVMFSQVGLVQENEKAQRVGQSEGGESSNDSEDETFAPPDEVAEKPRSHLECCFCDRRYQHSKAVNKHMLSEHLSECQSRGWHHRCKKCGCVFTSAKGRDKHCQRVHGGKTDKSEGTSEDSGEDDGEQICCPFEHSSPIIVSDLRQLRSHIREEHPEKEQSFCLVCGDDQRTREQMLDHVRQAHKNVTFIPRCADCDERFLSAHAMEQHRRQKHSQRARTRTWRCRHCPKTFKSERFWTAHELRHNSGEEAAASKALTCSVCSKRFSNRHNLVRHCRSAHEVAAVNEYKCGECGKSFVDSTRLKQHKWIHAGYRPYECRICGKAFRHLSHLRGHGARAHGEEKSFKCQRCEKTFLYAYQLRRHVSSAHGDSGVNDKDGGRVEDDQFVHTLYQCAVCQAVFQDYEALHVHCTERHVEDAATLATASAVATELRNLDRYVPIPLHECVMSLIHWALFGICLKKKYLLGILLFTLRKWSLRWPIPLGQTSNSNSWSCTRME